jgi:hypothetical protein
MTAAHRMVTINKMYDKRKEKGQVGSLLHRVTLYGFGSLSQSLCTPTSFSSSVTTSCGLVTCHLASVRFDGCPTAVVKMSSGVNCSSVRWGSRIRSSAISETDSGASIMYGRGDSMNWNARNMSSSVYCGRGECQPTSRRDDAGRRTLSSPAQKTNWASGFRYKIRLTISPLLIAIGRTSRFFLPTRTTKLLSDLESLAQLKCDNTFDRPFVSDVVL